ncbi:YcxB family protein [Cohnella candidum]|uniref:YcxB family protein n=1 Tax=Cohnella candidum TaxID=2674991 RepID=A0A3G3JZH9_9BACL|nr:YcxB family protein [Cohnella candidum]AYQ73658.1 YcxB family protein [Cohnella candidum]
MSESVTRDPSVRVNLTAEDYAGFNLYHGRWQLAGLFLFYWCLFVIFAQLSGVLGDSGNLAIVIPAAFFISGILLIFQLWRIKVRTTRIFESDKVSKLEQHIVLTEKGILHTTGDTTVQVPWDDVFKAREIGKAVILYLSRNKVVMIPKRDIADIGEIRAALRKHLPAGKLKLNG